MSKHIGKCALCRAECELTFEHIPPHKAYNWFPRKTISGEGIAKTIENGDRKPWDFSGLRYSNQQQGLGEYSLCQSCNNLTGAWYGDAYVEFAKTVHKVVVDLDLQPGDMVHIETTIKPLNIIKQVASLFCSINTRADNDSPFKVLRNFVLNKEENELPSNQFRIGMYVFRGNMSRRCAATVRVLKGPAGITMETVSEMTAYPIGFMLFIDPDPNVSMNCADITKFCKCKYDEECKVEMNVPVYECNIAFPGDFRSKDEILKCMKSNRE